MTYENICVPSFLRKHDDSLCNTCRYRNMDDDETECGNCMEECAVMDDDTGRKFMDRCRRHLETISGSQSGKGGYDRTRNVTDIIFHDFALDEVNGWIILLEFNTRCQPAWSVDALRHMMQQAIDQPPTGRKRGLLRDRFIEEIDAAVLEEWQRRNRPDNNGKDNHDIQNR